MIELPARNPFCWEVVVDSRAVDVQGHASNVAVLEWMNTAAWEHSKALGWNVEDYRRAGGWFVVRRNEIDYHGRALLGDRLLCYTWPSGVAKATAERSHLIVRAADEATIAKGRNVWAYVDAATARPVRIPPAIRESFDPVRFV